MRIEGDRTVRKLGAALCVLGALIVGYAAVEYGMGALRAEAARRQWEEQQAHATVAMARERASRNAPGVVTRLAVGAPVARLWIPRIHLDEVVLEGVGDDELNAAPGHLPGSALPGLSGNSVISAHRDRHFSRLDELQIGDTIRTETSQSSGSWVIVARRVLGKDTPALFQTKEPILTLTTCWPVRYFGSAPDRLILSAKPVAGSWSSPLTASTGDI